MFDPNLLQPLPPAVTHRRIDAALKAAQADANGLTHENARELLTAELRARGIMPPPPAVDVLADLIAGGSAQRQVQRLTATAKFVGLAARSLSAVIRHRPLPNWDVAGIRSIHSTLPWRPVEVILDQDVSQFLDVGDADTFEVWFAHAASSSAHEHIQVAAEDAARQPVAVFRGDYRVGALDAETSAAWRSLVQEGRDEHRTVVTFATRRRADDGEWRLLIGLPYAGRGHPGNSEA